MKIIQQSVVAIAWMLFLTLIGEDCLHWYTISLSKNIHQILFLGMIGLSSTSSFIALFSLMRIRHISQTAVLKLLAAPPEMETRVETVVHYSNLYLTSVVCFNIVAAVWGVIYLSGGPFVKTWGLALSVFVASNTVGTIAGVKLERLKRGVKLKRAKV